jgi:Na+/melibiose symporter-like transporter
MHRFGYALGSGTLGFVEASIAIFYLFYLTNIVGIGAALAGTVLALPKIWDTFVDPIVGTWVDRLATRLGTRWPFVLAAGLTICAAYVGMFSLPVRASHWVIAIASFLLLIILSTSRTVFGICQLSMSTEMTDDEAQLSGLYSLALTFVTIVSVGGAVLPPLLIAWFGGGRSGYAFMAGVGALASCLMLVAFVGMTKNVPVRPVTGTTASQSLFASFRATIRNGAFISLLSYYVVLIVCTAMVNTFTPYLNLYLLHGDQSKLAILTGISAVSGVLGYPMAPYLVRRFGACESLKVANVVTIATYVALFFATYSSLWVIWLATAATGICSGLLAVLFLAALVDVARTPVAGGLVVPLGFYFGVIISGLKLGQSAGGIFVGFLLSATGFLPNAAHQSVPTLMGIRAGYTLLPAALFAMCALFLNGLMGESGSNALTQADHCEQ